MEVTAMQVFEKAKEDVADKVRKLLTQAEDPAATPEEAQSFTMKAQQLMTKYSIDLAMVADTTRTDEMTGRGWTVQAPYASQKVSLINAVSRANDCRAIYSDLGQGRKHIEVVGYATDVEWVEILSRSLDVQLATALAGAVRTKPAGVHGRTFSVGFVQGFVSEVSRRLQEARRAAVKASEESRKAEEDERREVRRRALEAGLDVPEPEPATAAASVALVLVAKAEQVEEEFRVRHPRARMVYRQVRLQSWSGFDPGRDAGRRANLARGAVGQGRRSLSA
jgi:hypothetical protein